MNQKMAPYRHTWNDSTRYHICYFAHYLLW